MSALNQFFHRLRALFRRRNLEQEMADEMRFHLKQRSAENLTEGMAPDEAMHAAQRKFGGLEQIKERCRDERRLVWVEQVSQDVRYAARSLCKNLGFTSVVVLTLALGIGANTAIFSVVNAVLLKPLPYSEPSQLAQLCYPTRSVIGAAEFLKIRAESQSLARLAAYSGGDINLTGAGQAQRLAGGQVTADFFPLLGIQPVLGRNFTREEDTPNGPRAVILGYDLWQGQFGGDPSVLGRAITLNAQSFTVVGVLPATFQFPERFQLWTPLTLQQTIVRGGRFLKAIARLKPGVPLQQARSELQTIAQRDQSPRPAGGDGGLTLIGLHEQVVGDVKGALFVLLAAVAFVLLIACANIANLLLARAATRQREMAVRAALGAGRWRVVRAMLTESMLLSLVGGGLGLLLAFWGVRALAQLSSSNLPTMHEIAIDGWALAFTLGVSVVTGVGFGLAPAVQAWRTDVNSALKGDDRGQLGGNRHRLRGLLVVSEVALALVLLIGAGLLIKSFSRLLDVNPGFQAEGVLTFQLILPEEQRRSAAQKTNFIEQIVERLKLLPGVQVAAATDSLPLAHFAKQTSANVEGRPPIDYSQMTREEIAASVVSGATVTSDYFNAMGIPVKSGRAFTAQDARPAAGTVVVNEAFAKRNFPGEDAVGKRIRLGSREDAPWLTVVGVVSDVRQTGLAKEVMPEVYSPELGDAGAALCFAVRLTGEPTGLISAVRAVVAEVNPNQPLYNVTTMEQRLANTTASRRLNTILLGSFATLALLLAAVGIYGVMSYAVTQRRREIGVRMALGAKKGDVLGLIIGGGLRLALSGVGIGLIGAFALTRYMSSLLYSVNATDPITFLGVAVALTGVALLASWLPAIRATRVDPLVALRCE